MATVSYCVAVSVDGFIADATGNFSRFSGAGDHVQHYLDWMAGCDVVIMGHSTYKVGLAQGATDPYPALETYVASRTLQSPDPAVTVTRDPGATVAELRKRPGQRVYLCGGGQLASALEDAGLIDELVIKENPIVLGTGIPLFARPVKSSWRLDSRRAFDSGVSIATYSRIR